MSRTMRDDVFRYVKRKYRSEIEYLWARFPRYAVFRHGDNRKWYGIVMDIPRSRLGLPGEEPVDVLNVKLDDVLLCDLKYFMMPYLLSALKSWTKNTAAAAVMRTAAVIFRMFSLSFLRKTTERTAKKAAARTLGTATFNMKADMTFPAVPSSGELK